MTRLDRAVLVTGLTIVLGSVAVAYGWYTWKTRESTRALRRKRKDQGNHECEVLGDCSSLTMESESRWDDCVKNPGHLSFIPAKQFSLRHLPEALRSEEILGLVQNVAARTVRLRVNYTSLARPEGFPFYHSRGERVLHTGSGWVRDIHACYGPCRCRQCQATRTPHTQWWLVRVHTACHVVFDTAEARETSVDVFYDADKPGTGTEGARTRMKTMQGLRVIVKNEDQDLCRFYCITHDQELVNRLQRHMKQWEKQPTTLMGMANWQENHAPLCIVVSHPHGYSKQVTIGQWTGHTEQNEIGECGLTYRTDTCTGSSGAPVILPRRQSVNGHLVWTPTVFPHSGALSHGVNLSAIGGVFPSI
ncbi:hypothetical protein ElyMa_004196000 [Elysia marginata]|uniref:Peptidase S1 domain-containing protein n=1 Tax=Elysia marginata TaxID=1093978 RepID=A0AAV4GLF8_9GAST|nr:hypothetical protein ElyMa_004196000 [Elysia marginata]